MIKIISQGGLGLCSLLVLCFMSCMNKTNSNIATFLTEDYTGSLTLGIDTKKYIDLKVCNHNLVARSRGNNRNYNYDIYDLRTGSKLHNGIRGGVERGFPHEGYFLSDSVMFFMNLIHGEEVYLYYLESKKCDTLVVKNNPNNIFNCYHPSGILVVGNNLFHFSDMCGLVIIDLSKGIRTSLSDGVPTASKYNNFSYPLRQDESFFFSKKNIGNTTTGWLLNKDIETIRKYDFKETFYQKLSVFPTRVESISLKDNIVAITGNILTSINKLDGEINWSKSLPISIVGAWEYDDHSLLLYTIGEDNTKENYSGHIHSKWNFIMLSAESGRIEWEFKGTSEPTKQPLPYFLNDKFVIIDRETDKVIILSVKTGESVREIEMEGEKYSLRQLIDYNTGKYYVWDKVAEKVYW